MYEAEAESDDEDCDDDGDTCHAGIGVNDDYAGRYDEVRDPEVTRMLGNYCRIHSYILI